MKNAHTKTEGVDDPLRRYGRGTMKRQVDGTTQRRGTIPGFDDLFSPRGLLRSLRHKLIVFRRTAARRCICRQTAHPVRHVRDMLAGRPTARAR